MKISPEEVLHVADLARLSIADDNVESFREQLGSILAYVEKLGEVDTTGVLPTAHAVELATAFREDAQSPHLTNEEAVANAPEALEGEFIVPRVIE
jgi:aspartyl-tRNA(Asn)/glutamyl-tRNA(Gln) amidotransferase subunit C